MTCLQGVHKDGYSSTLQSILLCRFRLHAACGLPEPDRRTLKDIYKLTWDHVDLTRRLASLTIRVIEHQANKVTCTWYHIIFIVCNYFLIQPLNFNEPITFVNCSLTPLYIWHPLQDLNAVRTLKYTHIYIHINN